MCLILCIDVLLYKVRYVLSTSGICILNLRIVYLQNETQNETHLKITQLLIRFTEEVTTFFN